MKLRPLFVTGSLVHGGAERHSITVMNRLAARGYDCHAVYVKNDPSQLERIDQRQVRSVRCLHAQRFFDPAAIADFATHLRRVQPSVLVAANGYALLYASLARAQARLRIPVVVTFHTTQVFGFKEHLKMLIDRPVFWHAQRTIFVCEMQRRYWLRRGLGSRHNDVIYNGVDIDHFRDHSQPVERQATRHALGFAENDYVIAISAVLRPEKNHRQLVDAVRALRDMGLPARILMIGDGPLRASIEAHSRELGVEDSVRLTGFVDDVRPYLAACDVSVLCSLSETFSLAALEAMAMGKPVVHSAVGGAAEMIMPGNNGYLFQAGNTAELIHRLLVLAEPGVARSMGGAARRLVETRFADSVMVDRYENILSEVSASRPDVETPADFPAFISPAGKSPSQSKSGVSHENI